MLIIEQNALGEGRFYLWARLSLVFAFRSEKYGTPHCRTLCLPFFWGTYQKPWSKNNFGKVKFSNLYYLRGVFFTSKTLLFLSQAAKKVIYVRR